MELVKAKFKRSFDILINVIVVVVQKNASTRTCIATYEYNYMPATIGVARLKNLGGLNHMRSETQNFGGTNQILEGHQL